jgi:hypothetical protein
MMNLLSGFPTPRLGMPAELMPLYVNLAAVDKTFVIGSIWGGGATSGNPTCF